MSETTNQVSTALLLSLKPGIEVYRLPDGGFVLEVFAPGRVFEASRHLTPDEARRLARALAEAGEEEGKKDGNGQ